VVTYGAGTFSEAYNTLFGWNAFNFKFWYIVGAFLGGYPLAQGSIYLLMNRKFAHGSAIIVMFVISILSVFVILTPLDYSVVETYRLSGEVIKWQWIRYFTPLVNLYAFFFLVGGAILSAWRFKEHPMLRNRHKGNILIAIGALLPGIGGTLTKAGYMEALYITELLGILLIYFGYKTCLKPVSNEQVPSE